MIDQILIAISVVLGITGFVGAVIANYRVDEIERKTKEDNKRKEIGG